MTVLPIVELAEVGVRCHGIGWLVREVTINAGPGITVLTGPVGSGTSLLLGLLGGIDLPQVRNVRGRIRVGGLAPGHRSAAEIGQWVQRVEASLTQAGSLRSALAQAYGGQAPLDHEDDLELLGLTAHLDSSCSTLPSDIAGRASLALALAHRPGVLLVDEVAGNLTPDWAHALARRLRQAADQGTTVLWAEHDLDVALPVADQIVELAPGTAHVSPAATWRPRTRPTTVLRALAARAGLDPAVGDDPERLTEQLAAEHISVLSRGTQRRRLEHAHAHLVPEELGLTGPEIPLSAGETIGVVSSDPHQAIVAARQLARGLGGRRLDDRRLTLALDAQPVARVCTRLERQGWLSPLSTLRELLGSVGSRIGRDHSPGQRQVMAAGLALGQPQLGLLIEPTRGVDLTTAMILRELLGRPRDHAVLIASRDIEFLVRACDRLLLVEGQRITADASPTALLSRLPHAPLITQMVPGLRAVRLRDLSLVRERARKESA